MNKLFLSVLLLISVVSIAQRPQGRRPNGQRPNPITITGTVLDQETGDPLEYRKVPRSHRIHFV